MKKWKTRDISYLKQAPTGVPGDITRVDESSVEPAMVVGVGSPPVYPTEFGVAMEYAAGPGGTTGIQQFNTGSETSASFAGILVREAPQISGSIVDDQTLQGGSPYSPVLHGLLVRGYVNVLCKAGTPVRGGVVYVQIVTQVVGGVTINPGEFRADGTGGGNAIALTATQAEWAADGVDTFLNAEVRVYR
jgi:hypothetical protein